jgi:pyruvate kinase
MHRLRRAKIVATVGPASSSPEMLRKLFLAGVDTFRLNFSHGSHADHAQTYAHIRALEEEFDTPIGVLQDLQGPKIRVGTFRDGKIEVGKGEAVRFVRDSAPGDRDGVPLPHPEIFSSVRPGHDLLIDDGRVRVRIVDVRPDAIDTEVVVGGVISDRKGVNLPGAVLALSPLTAKDRADLAFGLELGVDWVALSFVQKASDVIEAQRLIAGRAGLLAKIEKPSALQHLADIIRLADGVMVARGDLGVEIPQEEVPGRQKEIVRACRLVGKPVIVATQMLDSMVNSPSPTRAEASDVATAIYDGADAVMLSAESAAGKYPLEAVQMMDRIIRSTEAHEHYASLVQATRPDEEHSPPHVMAAAAADVAQSIGAPVIVAFTSSGATAARIARKRPALPILAVTPELSVSRRLRLMWGVHSERSPQVESYDEMIIEASKRASEEGFVRYGDLFVVVAGIPFNRSGTTNNLRIVQI